MRHLLAIGVTAAIYVVAGRLALLMAIPPGYATAVWPAAGLALVCVLVWGPRVTLGVAIGSFAVNLGADDPHAIVVAAIIAIGAALQALIGATLVRRRVGFPTPLEEQRDILHMVALGGPVACLVSCTLAVATLCVAGVVEWSSFGFSWWTWWAGDTIGVLVFAPLALLVVPSPHAVWRRRRGIVGVPLVVGFCIVTLVFVRASAWERGRLRTDFERRAQPVGALLRTQLSKYEELVTGVASYLEASPSVTRSEFATFCRRALAGHSGLIAVSWNPRVSAADRGDYEARAGIHFQLRDAHGVLVPEPPRDAYVPIYYVEPDAPNHDVLGYDTASDPVRREVQARADRAGGIAASGRIELVQDRTTHHAGVLLVAAVRGRPGYAVGALRIASMIDAALDSIDHEGLALALLDESAPGAAPLYTSDSTTSAAPTSSIPLQFADRMWRLDVAPTVAYASVQRSWQAWMVLAGGLLFVGLLGIVLLMTTGRVEASARIERQLEVRVAERTAALTAALREREVLLQEIHHRVKNNLQVISSLINMQVRKLDDTTSRDALDECQTRIQAIALIHEKLYQSKDYARVPFSEYARTLVSNVFHGMNPGEVELKMDIDDVAVPVDKAIPCGLLLNELITNALKHAFKDGRGGRIDVGLMRDGSRLRLVVQDDGIGLPAGLDLQHTDSLGMQLVTTLAEQLDASLDVVNRGGARFEVSFAMEN